MAAEEELVKRVQERFHERMAEKQPAQDREKILAAMRANGADPAYIYAYEQTGILVFQETMHLLDPADLERWVAAYEAYPGSL